MTEYRIYVLTPQERIDETRQGCFPDDAAALAQAEALRRDGYAAEVWAGERLVGRVGGEFSL